jgi:hypothetical protein
LFETIFGLPLHPLAIHAAVVFVALLTLGSAVYALVPMLRARIRWVVVLLALAGIGSAWLAKLSGDAFRRRQIRRHVSAGFLAQIDAHKSFGDATFWAALSLGVLTLALVVVTLNRPPVRRSASTDGSDAGGTPAGGTTGVKVVQLVLVLATVVMAVVTGYYVYKTGDSGARMAWGTS